MRQNTTRFLAITATLSGLLLTAPARGDLLVPNQEFLDRSFPSLLALSDSSAAGTRTVEETVKRIRQVLAERHRALIELHRESSLTTPTGVETQDRYDAFALEITEKVLAAGPPAEALPRDSLAVAIMDAALGPMPDLGRTPLPFMVITLIDRTCTVADSLVAQHHLPPHDADVVLLRVIQASVARWDAVRSDPFFEASGQDMRHNSIVLRLRCPKDAGTYNMNYMKNQFREGNNISRLYYLQCSVCAEPLLLEFPLDLVSRLNRMAERQKGVHPPTPPRSYSIEP